MTLPPPGYLAVRSSAKPIGYWKKPMFFAFADARVPLSSLELVHKKGVKKNARRWKRDRLTKSIPPGEYEASNEELFRAMAIAAVSGSGILAAYRVEDTERPVALVNLRDVVDVALSPKLSKKKRFAFTMRTAAGKRVVFAARSEKERESWVMAVQHLARVVKGADDVEATCEYRSVYESLVTKSAFGESAQVLAFPSAAPNGAGENATADETKPVVAVAVDAEVAGESVAADEPTLDAVTAIDAVAVRAAEVKVDLEMSEIEDDIEMAAPGAADPADEASAKVEIAAEPEADAERAEVEDLVEKVTMEAADAVSELEADVEGRSPGSPAANDASRAVEREREVAPATGAADSANSAPPSAAEPAAGAGGPAADQVDLELRAFVAQMLDEIFRKAVATAAASSEPEPSPAGKPAPPARVKKGMFSLYVPIWARRT